MKVCFCASSGGHFEQLMMLEPLLEKYNGFIVTEKTKYGFEKEGVTVRYVMQINRTDKFFTIRFLFNIYLSLKILFEMKPDAVISTGALATIPIMFWAKLFRKKVIYIESFAKINSPSMTGRFAYKIADQFYIQWESMRKFYPTAIYKGGIY